MRDAEKVLKILSQTQIDFIEEEFGITKAQIKAMDDDTIAELYDRLCDIEVDETIASGDDELSERGDLAEGLVTVIGNELYRPDGEPEY